MSAQDAKKLIDLISSDPELQEEVRKVHGNMLNLAAQKGLQVSKKELNDELHARWGIEQPKDDPDTCTLTIA